jgi:N-acetylneuraminic acid mutarotase
MIVWGGRTEQNVYTNAGARYSPANDSWTPTSIGPNVPSGRLLHTAVWTGGEMIVWGGKRSIGTANLLSTGGRYNPSSDTWSSVSSGAGVPVGRVGHTAVWTGSEMIIWGGVSGSGILDTGGRYAPGSDTWVPVSTGANLPTARHDHIAAWTGSEMIICGGNTSTEFHTDGRYDPVADSWRAMSTGPMSTAAKAVWTGSKLLAVGGFDSPGLVYEPSSDAWSTIEDVLTARRIGHVVVWTGSEMIIWGGSVASQDTNTGARYDPSSDSWVDTSMGSTPPGQMSATAVWTGTEMIFWGGTRNQFSSDRIVNTGGRYTPATDSWATTSVGVNVPSPRIDHTAIWSGREMIVWGGNTSDVDVQPVGTGGRYDPISDTWSQTSTGMNAPSARSAHVAVWTGSAMIVWCGYTSSGESRTGSRYDPVTDTWIPVADGTSAPPYCSGTLFAFWTGSEMITSTVAGIGGRYNPVTDSWTTVSAGPTQSQFAAVWTGKELIEWGGHGGTYLNSGTRFDPATNLWTPTSTGANVPAPRDSATAIWTGAEMLIWGGRGTSNGAVETTTNTIGGGRYNPSTDTWAPFSAEQYSPKRRYVASVWTGTQMIIWGGGETGQDASAMGGLYCACPNGTLVYRDADGDGYGDPGVSIPSCDGSIPAGYVIDHTDCNDSSPSAHPGTAEVCDGIDNDCNGLIDESSSAEDADADGLHDLCDNCPYAFNSSQSDFDGDGEGDACDLDDGLIYVLGTDNKNRIEWQPELGYTTWNSYRGSLAVLRATGQYTQAPGSNPLASRDCGLADPYAPGDSVPDPGEVAFNLVTGVAGGVESNLGANSGGVPRANANPCP